MLQATGNLIFHHFCLITRQQNRACPVTPQMCLTLKCLMTLGVTFQFLMLTLEFIIMFIMDSGFVSLPLYTRPIKYCAHEPFTGS